MIRLYLHYFYFFILNGDESSQQVARDAVLKFRPHISITPYHANVKGPDFDVDFFKQFNVVLNGLDNLDARRHVNRLCLAAEVPLVESGTTGFLGQVNICLAVILTEIIHYKQRTFLPHTPYFFASGFIYFPWSFCEGACFL